jgi:hypothetical protein
MFGEELINAHKKIFEDIVKNYDTLKFETQGNIINLEAYLKYTEKGE